MISSSTAKTNLVFGLALGVLIAISVLSYGDAGRLIDAARWVGHSGEVLARVKELEGKFNEIVLIHSAYAARPDSLVAGNFEVTSRGISSKVNQLILLTHDNPQQQARLRVLANVAAQRLRPGQLNAALVDWIRGQVSAIEQHEERLLARRQEAERRHALRAKYVIALGGVLSALLIVGAVVIVNRDATRRQTVAQDLGRSKEVAEAANRTKGEFLANMSHEIRTPLNGVLGMLELLQDTELNKDQRRFTEAAKGSADSLLMILNDILDFSKIEAGKLDFEFIDFDLREAVEQSFEVLAARAAEKGLELGALVEPDVPSRLRGDPGRLRQILANLVGNGIKFTEHGEVTVRVFKERENERDVGLRFEVKDTGIGISPEAQQRLFQSFSQGDGSTTRKFGGTGLGLAICRQLVSMMNGTIGVNSEPGSGSTFWFTVMMEKPSLDACPAIPKENLTGLRVLVVDDNFTNREVLYHQTKAWQMRTDTASDAEAALRLLRDASTNDPYRVAILDQQMPGVDGFGLARLIKSEPAIAGTRLVLLSSLGANPEGDGISTAGFEACLVKPVKQSRLLDCMVAVVGEPLSQTDEPMKPADDRTFEPAPEDLPESQVMRILLAEDSAINQDVAVGQLKKLGYSPDVVNNGREVLEALEFLEYDVVLMDCHMPEMDGYQAAGAIRERENSSAGSKPPLYMIAMTASAMEGDRDLCLKAGMNDYLSKPVSSADLTAALERAALHQALAGSQLQTALDLPSAPLAPAEPESAVHPDDKPPVDVDRLRELTAGDPASLRLLIDRYVREADDMMDRLGSAVQAAAAGEIRHWAHKLGGTSATVGITAVVPVLRQMEELSSSGELSTSHRLLSQVSFELNRTQRFLSNYLEQVSRN